MTELIQAIIGSRHKVIKEVTVTRVYEDAQVVIRYYRKGKDIWCKITCGDFIGESLVHREILNPYVCFMDMKWYLNDDLLAVMNSLL